MTRTWTVVAWFSAAAPVVGWIVAQTLTSRIAEFSGFTGALFHAVTASTFAVILFISAVINAVVITQRSVDTPRSYRWARLGAWQVALLALELAWLTCIVVGQGAVEAEFFVGIGIAVASCVVFAFAMRRDPDASLRRSRRLAARPPELVRRIRAVSMVVPIALAATVIGGVVVAAVVPIHHSRCDLVGWSSVTAGDTRHTMMTTCGDFLYDRSLWDDSLLDTTTPFDMTTQGFVVFPFALRLIAFEPSD